MLQAQKQQQYQNQPPEQDDESDLGDRWDGLS